MAELGRRTVKQAVTLPLDAGVLEGGCPVQAGTFPLDAGVTEGGYSVQAVTLPLDAGVIEGGYSVQAVTLPLDAGVIEGGDSEQAVTLPLDAGVIEGGDSEQAVTLPLDAGVIEGGDSEQAVTLPLNAGVIEGGDSEQAVTLPLDAGVIEGGDSEQAVTLPLDAGVIEGGDSEQAVTLPLDAGVIEGGDSEHSSVSHGDEGNLSGSALQGHLKSMSISQDNDSDNESDPEYWTLLPPEIDALILARLGLYDLFRSRAACKSFRDVVKRKTFQQARGSRHLIECSLSPLVFYVKGGNWHILGYEYKDKLWRKLPYLDSRPADKDVIPIPIPDMDLFKDFLVSGDGGLFCVNVGKPTEPERILVFNPLNGLTVLIPPLLCPRHPVVLHVHATLAKSFDDVVTSKFWILAVGSSATGTESLSRKTEVYDSVKGVWEAAGDVPGTDFSINEHQSGVYCESENAVLVTGFMVSGNKGVLVFDMETRTWREDWLCPYLQQPVQETGLPVHFAIAQLLECSGVIYLFSEQEFGTNVTHCIDELHMIRGGGFSWTRKLTRQRQGYRALLVYPEYTCVPVRENKLCIFNTIERNGVVYNMLDDPIDPDVFDSVPVTPPLEPDGIVFHSLNPVGYAYEPSFGAWAG